MAACKFIVPFTGGANEILLKARTAILGQGGTFTGDDSGGSFDVSVMGNTIKGSYSVIGQEMNMLIESKPFFVPCSAIESFLKNKIG